MDRRLLTSKAEQRVELRIEGEIDLANSRGLRGQLESLMSAGQTIEVDLSAVTFLDSSGLAALLAAHRHAVERGAGLILVAPSEPVARLLELTGCLEVFEVVVGDALGEPPAR